MSCLLDTHTLLWARLDPDRLPAAHRQLLQSREEQKYISTITIWEISLKFALGKLDLGGHTPEEFMRGVTALGIAVVAPPPEQLASFHQLPEVVRHKGPFDRMLIWQAMQSGLPLLSSDRKMVEYRLHGLALA